MIRVIAVARVSDARQATGGYGPDAQRNDMQTFAAAHGLSIVGFIEDRISGTVPLKQRAGGRKLYEYIASKRIDGVLFPRVDRLGRDEDGIEVLQLRKDIREAGLKLFWADRGEADLSGLGGLMDFMQAIAAGEDRKKIVRNTGAGKLAQVRAGQTMVSARPPYGYARISTPRSAKSQRTERLEIDADEAKVVRKIFKWCVEGASISGIAERLSQSATPSRADTHEGYAVRVSKRWSRSTIGGILRNRAYTGEWRFNKRQVIRPTIKGEGKHTFIKRPESEHITVQIPAIVTVELFEQVQARLEQNKHNTRPPKRTYLLRGMCRCGVCGRAMIGRPQKKYAAYVCSHNTTVYGSERCKSPEFSTARIDGIVWDFVTEILTHPARIMQYHDEAKPDSRADELVDAKIRVEQLQVMRRNWERMLASERTNDETFDAETSEIDRVVAGLNETILGIERESNTLTHAAKMVSTIEAMAAKRVGNLRKLDNADKRKFIEGLELRFVLARNDTHYIITASAPWLRARTIEALRPNKHAG